MPCDCLRVCAPIGSYAALSTDDAGRAQFWLSRLAQNTTTTNLTEISITPCALGIGYHSEITERRYVFRLRNAPPRVKAVASPQWPAGKGSHGRRGHCRNLSHCGPFAVGIPRIRENDTCCCPEHLGGLEHWYEGEDQLQVLVVQTPPASARAPLAVRIEFG